MGYTAVGEHVGLAQRMESAAPPGGVMLSESTARLVENAAVLSDRRGPHQRIRRSGGRTSTAGYGDTPRDRRKR